MLRARSKFFGGHSDRVTPVPIPNTEVKPVSADGTWGESPWESRTPPDFALKKPPPEAGASSRPGLELHHVPATPLVTEPPQDMVERVSGGKVVIRPSGGVMSGA